MIIASVSVPRERVIDKSGDVGLMENIIISERSE